MIGQTVSHYKILEKLGAGGMGVVYRAEDTVLKRTVALKFLPPEISTYATARERFVHEAQAASALEHPNICDIHDIGQTDDGQTFIVMSHYDGETLKERVKGKGFRVEEAVDIAVQICQGLSRAHEAGIIHRDIKPANIMLTGRGEVKILDFGLAKLTGQTRLTKTGTTLGTVAYMSPEQARGEAVDQRTDIWSVGVVLYEMLSGRPPFVSENEQALVYSILNEDPAPVLENRPDVPDVVRQIVAKSLSKRVEDRYQTVGELLSDLKTARGKETSGGTIAAAEAAARRRKKKLTRNLVVAGAAAAILAASFFVVIPLIQDQAIASNPRAIAFISLENRTGEDSLERFQSLLPHFLGMTLEDSKYLRVTRSDRMRQLMKQVGKDTVEFIDRETGLRLCRRAGIDVMGVGSFTKAGTLFLADLELIDVKSGERLGGPMEAWGPDVESFIKEGGIVHDLAKQISRTMGVSQLSSQAAVKPVAEISSSSIEAQWYYQKGKRELDRFKYQDARRFLELAVKEDSTFAIAWFHLAFACSQLGDGPAQEFAHAQAMKNAQRATERERAYIAFGDSSVRASLLKNKGREDAIGSDVSSWLKAFAEIFPYEPEIRRNYAVRLSYEGKVTQAIAELEKVLQLDPAYALAYSDLGYNYVYNGQGEKGMQMLERSAELDPGEPNPLQSMAECLLILGRFDEGIRRCEAALHVKPDFFYAALTLAKLHFMKEEYDEAIRWVDRAMDIPSSPAWQSGFLWWRAWYLIWSGRLREAEEALRASEKKLTQGYQMHAVSEADRNDNLAGIYWLRAWCAYEESDWKKARQNLLGAAGLRPWPWLCQFGLGLVDIQEGKMDSGEVRLEQIRNSLLARSQRRPESAMENEDLLHFFKNALDGARLLAAGRPAEIRPNWVRWKCQFIQNPDSLTTASWPLVVPMRTDAAGIHWIPIPFDILPRSYIQRGMIDSAIASYELAIKKPPHLLGPIIPRYYYRLARLYEKNGMRGKAIEHYTTFLKVWGKADPVYREPADARARLAKLSGEKRSVIR